MLPKTNRLSLVCRSILRVTALLGVVAVLFPAHAFATAPQCKVLFARLEARPEISQPVSKQTSQIDTKLSAAADYFNLPPNWKKSPKKIDSNRITSYQSSTDADNYQNGIRITLDSMEPPDHELPLVTAKPVVAGGLPTADLLGETLSFQGKNFQLLNVGSRQLMPEVQKIEQRLSEVLQTEKDKAVIIPVNREYWLARSKLNSFQSTTSYLTTMNYKKWKHYLLNEDLQSLRMGDSIHEGNNEYVVVLKDSHKNILEMSEAEYTDNLVAAMRLARAQKRFSMDGLEQVGPDWGPELPSLVRLNERQKKKTKVFLSALMDKGYRLAELTRFSRFQSVPKEIMNTLVLRMFEFARHPTDPVDVFFMAVDKDTRALFADYNFTELFEMTEPGAESPEYLMYLDTHSPEYEKTIAFLRTAVTGVEIAKNNSPLPMTKPMQYWKYNPAMAEFSSMQKEDYAHEKMLEFRIEKKLRLQHLQLGLPHLKDTAITSEKQITQITEQIAALPHLPVTLLQTLENLSDAERQTLRDNVEIFSDDFLHLASALNTDIPSRGRIYIFSFEKNSLAETLAHQYPEREIHVINSLENLPADPAEAVLIVNSLTDISGAQRAQVIDWAHSVLQKHREIVLLEATSSKSWEEAKPDGLSLKNNLLNFTQSAFKNGATPTEAELVLSLATARLYFEKSISTSVQEKDLRKLAGKHGFTVDFNLPHRISWLLGGQLQSFKKP